MRECPLWPSGDASVSRAGDTGDRASTFPSRITPVTSPCRRLDGLVVKASASRGEDPGFLSPLATGFFRVE